MYTTCLFCNNALGTNDAIEHFPVGRRLAFDSATGRLWVVCGKCERWNLSPLESRWEAIEEAERAFRSTKLRVSTDNIGLAQLSDGTELVRIGKPLRAEFAAWRYGDQFGRRRLKVIGSGVAAAVAGSVLPALGSTQLLNAQFVMPVMVLGAALPMLMQLWATKGPPTIAIRSQSGALLRLTKLNAQCATISSAGHAFEWQVKVPHIVLREAGPFARAFGLKQVREVHEGAFLRDEAAKLALTKILPHSNLFGGGRRAVKAAIEVLNDAPNVNSLLHKASRSTPSIQFNTPQLKTSRGEVNLRSLPSSLRLALEMTLHEDSERRAMEGELHELEQRWKDADAIAKIADALLVPENVEQQLDDLRRKH